MAQCMICDDVLPNNLNAKQEDAHMHPGHPDSCWNSDGTHKKPFPDAAQAQDRAHAKWVKRNGMQCECEACKTA